MNSNRVWCGKHLQSRASGSFWIKACSANHVKSDRFFRVQQRRSVTRLQPIVHWLSNQCSVRDFTTLCAYVGGFNGSRVPRLRCMKFTPCLLGFLHTTQKFTSQRPGYAKLPIFLNARYMDKLVTRR